MIAITDIRNVQQAAKDIKPFQTSSQWRLDSQTPRICQFSTSSAVSAYYSYASLVGSHKSVRCSYYQCIRAPPEKVLNINIFVNNPVIEVARKLMER